MRRITDVDAYYYYSLLSVGKKEALKEYLDNEFILYNPKLLKLKLFITNDDLLLKNLRNMFKSCDRFNYHPADMIGNDKTKVLRYGNNRLIIYFKEQWELKHISLEEIVNCICRISTIQDSYVLSTITECYSEVQKKLITHDSFEDAIERFLYSGIFEYVDSKNNKISVDIRLDRIDPNVAYSNCVLRDSIFEFFNRNLLERFKDSIRLVECWGPVHHHNFYSEYIFTPKHYSLILSGEEDFWDIYLRDENNGYYYPQQHIKAYPQFVYDIRTNEQRVETIVDHIYDVINSDNVVFSYNSDSSGI